MAKGKGYTNIPNEEFDRLDIGGYTKLIYLLLLRFKNIKTGEAHPSQSLLVKLSGFSKNTVKRSIKELEVKNIIIPMKSLGKCNHYTFSNQSPIGTSPSQVPVPHRDSTKPSQGLLPVPHRDSIITNTNTNTIKKEIKKKKKVSPDNGLPDWLDKEWWLNWVTFRKEINKALKPSTIKLQINFLEKHKVNHAEILQQSIQNGWTGLFEIKDHKNFNNNNNKNNDSNEKHPVPYYKPEKLPTEKEIKENRDFAKKEIDKVMRMLGEEPKPRQAVKPQNTKEPLKELTPEQLKERQELLKQQAESLLT